MRGHRVRAPHPCQPREQLIAYTGTHDTNTALGWWQDEADDATRARSGLDPAQPAWSLVERVLGSRAGLAMLPARDVLELGAEARMNLPGTTGETNWQWRLAPGQLTPELAAKLRAAVAASQRSAPRAT